MSAELATLLRYYQLAGTNTVKPLQGALRPDVCFRCCRLPRLPTQGTPFGRDPEGRAAQFGRRMPPLHVINAKGGDLEMHNPPPDKEALEQARRMVLIH